MKTIRKSLLALAPVLLLLGSCNKEEQSVAPTIDNEVITTVTLKLMNKADAADVVTATINRLNATPDLTKDTLHLKANAIYSGQIMLADSSQIPATDITAEIKERQNIHLLVYTYTLATGGAITVTVTDKDTNPAPGPYPVGLAFDLATSAVGRGKLNVVLRHQPSGKNGTAAPGSTDLDTNFGVVVQ